jgi:hypothetical protein
MGYPYNEINEKLIHVFGPNQDVRYFIEDDIEFIKKILSGNNKKYDEIMSDFYAINICLETGVKKVYVNQELTPDQEALLNTETNSNTIQILLIISIIVNAVLACMLVFINKKSKRTNKV